MTSTYPDFFHSATGCKPYDYQRRLAEAACCSRLISVPTGLGKTAAVVLAWLWNRAHLKSDNWPRRLVYCLPMRTLVEQTRDEAARWLQNLDLTEKAGLHILMSGEDASDWDLHPERDAILVGTQILERLAADLTSRGIKGLGVSMLRMARRFFEVYSQIRQPAVAESFFTAATGKSEPYGYQQRLAAKPCISRLICVPTGLGKNHSPFKSWRPI